MDQLIEELTRFGLDIKTKGVQVAALLLAFFVLTSFIQYLIVYKRKKIISQMQEELHKEGEAKTLILQEKNEQTKLYNDSQKNMEALNYELEKNKKQLEKSNIENDKLNKQITNHQSEIINLEQKVKRSEESKTNDLETSKVIIKNKQDELSKLQTTLNTLKDQLQRDTKESILLNEKVKNLEDKITNEKSLLKVQENTNAELKNKIVQLEQDKLQLKKKEVENKKVQEQKAKIQEIKNIIFECFQDIDNPIFACYQQAETKGTYLHVNQVSQLSFHAAQAINANPYYARASSLFHDLGKTTIYKYFKENWPHNKESRLESENISYTYTHRGHMICSHVERGVQIFKKLLQKIPNDVHESLAKYELSDEELEFVFEEAKEDLQKSILEHQARAHVRMLYQEALKNGEICTPDDFEYMIGQIPSNKEQGIICLADSCEAAFSSNIYESEEAVEKLIQNVITGRVNSGHMDNSGLTTKDIQSIRVAFTEYLKNIWKSKRPDRMEEEVVVDPNGYSLHESGSDIIKKMKQRFVQGDHLQKRQVLRHFMDQQGKTLNAVNVEEFLQTVEENLNVENEDNILLTNSLIVFSECYKNLMNVLIDDINKNHPIHFGLTGETVDLELVQNEDISAYIEAKPSLKANLQRLQKIREIISSNIRKHRLYESPDVYVFNWITQIDNYMSNQSNIPEPLLNTDEDSEKKLENVVTLPEDFSHFITVKSGKIYISVNFDVFRCDCKFLRFVAYFYDSSNTPLPDNGGMFCTKENRQVAVLQSFLIKNTKFYTIKEPPIVLPVSELHLPSNFTDKLFAKIQIHGIKSEEKPILMLENEEDFTLG